MIELNYKTFGPIRRKAEKPQAVIILHGLFGMLDNWQSFGKKLAEDYQVFLVDHRDHGKSPHTDAFSYPLLANDLNNFIEAHELSDVLLIGHSMGGKTIMEFAINHPEKIDKMVVVDIGVKNYRGGHESIISALQAIPLETMESRKEADEFLSDLISNQSVRLFLMKNLTRKKEGGYKWKINLSLLSASYRVLMDHDLRSKKSEDTNVLFVRGGESAYILDKDREGLLEVFPKSQLKTIENAGHWVHAQEPEKLYSMVSSYFRGETS